MKITQAYWKASDLFESYGLILWSAMILAVGEDGLTYQLLENGIDALGFDDEGEAFAMGAESMTLKADALVEKIKSKGEINLDLWIEVAPRARYGTEEAERELIAFEADKKALGYGW